MDNQLWGENVCGEYICGTDATAKQYWTHEGKVLLCGHWGDKDNVRPRYSAQDRPTGKSFPAPSKCFLLWNTGRALESVVKSLAFT